MDAFRKGIVAASHKGLAIHKTDVHHNILYDLLHLNVQLGALCSHEVAGIEQFVAFRHGQFAVVMDAFRKGIVAAGYKSLAVHEANVHCDILHDLAYRHIQHSALFSHKVAGNCQLVAIRHIILQLIKFVRTAR